MLSAVVYYRTRPLRPLIFVPKAGKGRSLGRCVVKTQRGPLSRRLGHLVNYVPHTVRDCAQLVRFEQGRFRSSPVGLFRFLRSGFLSYLIVPSGMLIGDLLLVNFGTNVPAVSYESVNTPSFLNSFSVKPLALFSRGSIVHCVETSPFGGFKLCRSAGCFSVIEAISAGTNLVKVLLPSGKYSFLHGSAYAVSGSAGNKQHRLAKHRIAGQSFWVGKRPVTRGVAMNPIDHPHGGGEGKTSGGRPSVSASGVLAKGYRTLSYKRRCRVAALKQRFVFF